MDCNVILMIAGNMGIVHLFIGSRMPSLIADHIIHRTPSVKWVFIALALFAGIISALVDNVATVLMAAPVAIMAAKKLGISPLAGILVISVSSNLQGAATLVGDATAIMLGSAAELDFLDFFFYRGKPGMFFVVQAGALLSGLALMIMFHKYKQKVKPEGSTVVDDYFPSFLLTAAIAMLILASFIPGKPHATNGLVCAALLVIGLLRESLHSGNPVMTFRHAFMEIDFNTLALLAGLFLIIAGITEAGVVAAISRMFVKLSAGSLFAAYSLIVWASVLLYAFIDNIPYIAAMLPVVSGIAALMAVDPSVLYFGLLAGATLGGKLSPIGASANVTAIGILRRSGYQVKAVDFMRIRILFTLTAVVSGYALIWLQWGAGQ